MKNKSLLLAAATLISTMTVALATPIVGSIGFTGTYIQNGGTPGNLMSATSMNINSTTIGTVSGDFMGATFLSFATPISVNPAVGLSTLWSVLVGTTTYTFTSATEAQDLTSAAALHLHGTGVISDGRSADNTIGTWQLGFGVSGDSFQWQSTAAPANPAPDGGSTVLLLGAVLSGLGLIRNQAKA